MNDELLERYVECEIAKDQLDTLIAMIIEDASLSWDEKGLTVSSEAFMPYIKAIAPNYYKRKFEALKKEKEKDEN